MNFKRCDNGHFFDADQYETCPYCNGTVSDQDVTVPVNHGSDNVQSGLDKTVTEASSASSLQETINSVNDEGYIDDIDDYPYQSDDEKTIGAYTAKTGVDPVVGWLVCIEGDHFGKSFELKSGRNFIGRDRKMDVVLSGDLSVARERHAIIIYEPRGKNFIAQAGDAREMFYVNDEVVLSNMPLKTHDVLSIGNEKLVFVALCGKDFCWEDTKNKENKEEN